MDEVNWSKARRGQGHALTNARSRFFFFRGGRGLHSGVENNIATALHQRERDPVVTVAAASTRGEAARLEILFFTDISLLGF